MIRKYFHSKNTINSNRKRFYHLRINPYIHRWEFNRFPPLTTKCTDIRELSNTEKINVISFDGILYQIYWNTDVKKNETVFYFSYIITYFNKL